MQLATTEKTMAKKKMGRPPTGRRDVSVKIDAEVLRKVRHVATFEGQSVAEWLSNTVGALVDRRMREIAADILRRPEGPKR